MVSVSAECRPLYLPRYLPIVSQYVDHHSADISVDAFIDTSTDISRWLYRPRFGRYVNRHIGWHLADVSTDTSVKCWSRGAQNTHDPRKGLVGTKNAFGCNITWHNISNMVFDFNGRALIFIAIRGHCQAICSPTSCEGIGWLLT